MILNFKDTSLKDLSTRFELLINFFVKIICMRIARRSKAIEPEQNANNLLKWCS